MRALHVKQRLSSCGVRERLGGEGFSNAAWCCGCAQRHALHAVEALGRETVVAREEVALREKAQQREGLLEAAHGQRGAQLWIRLGRCVHEILERRLHAAGHTLLHEQLKERRRLRGAWPIAGAAAEALRLFQEEHRHADRGRCALACRAGRRVSIGHAAAATHATCLVAMPAVQIVASIAPAKARLPDLKTEQTVLCVSIRSQAPPS
ncbi:hypothetical protein PybrP1_009994 [[Pythium] brassicae (nom. inval.)]|nr:hypothetical protein PybrP1_009994 [[Pythium] brassicae (nom. inval.)]